LAVEQLSAIFQGIGSGELSHQPENTGTAWPSTPTQLFESAGEAVDGGGPAITSLVISPACFQ
jgi:hypothetical protein